MKWSRQYMESLGMQVLKIIFRKISLRYQIPYQNNTHQTLKLTKPKFNLTYHNNPVWYILNQGSNLSLTMYPFSKHFDRWACTPKVSDGKQAEWNDKNLLSF